MEIKIGTIITIKGSSIVREVVDIREDGIVAIRVDRKMTYYTAHRINPKNVKIVK